MARNTFITGCNLNAFSTIYFFSVLLILSKKSKLVRLVD